MSEVLHACIVQSGTVKAVLMTVQVVPWSRHFLAHILKIVLEVAINSRFGSIFIEATLITVIPISKVMSQTTVVEVKIKGIFQ